jgi:hypothetical protein
MVGLELRVVLSDAPNDISKRSLHSSDIMVNQNLIWATQVPGKPKRWTISLCLPEEVVALGEIQLPFNPTTSKRLPFVTQSLSPTGGGNLLPFVTQSLSPTGGGNLLYVNGAADAEKTAHLLCDLLGAEANVETDSAIAALIELAKNAVHEEYSLARVYYSEAWRFTMEICH